MSKKPPVDLEISAVRTHLEMYGYLDRYDYQEGSVLDEQLGRALKSFQSRYGLPISGVVDETTAALMATPRCGNSDLSFVLSGHVWQQRNLTYSVTKYSSQVGGLSKAEIDTAIAAAFAAWAAVVPLSFQRVEAAVPPDIEIKFATGNHGDSFPFMPNSGVLAHGFYPPPNSLPGDIHFNDAQPWSVTPGHLYQLASTAAHELGHALGLNHSDIPTSLMYPYYNGVVAPQIDDQVGIRAIYVPWQRLPGGAIDVSIGANGALWIVGTDQGVYSWTGQNWSRQPGGAVRIAVDPNGSPWITNSDGEIYSWHQGHFERRPGGAVDVGIGANGAVWIVGTDSGIYEWVGATWVRRPGGGTRIAVDSAGTPWIANARGEIYKWNGVQFVRKPGGATDIGIGADDSIWIIGTDGGVYRWNGPTESWSRHPGSGLNIAVSPVGKVCLTNRAGEIYQQQP